MPSLLSSFVLEMSNSPGVGTFSLAGALVGRRTFVQGFGSGNQAYYVAHDGTQWEEGYGTVTAGSPNTLSRLAVLANSAGTTAKINFTGAVQVYSGLPASRAVTAAADGASVPMEGRVVSGLGAGNAPADAPRWDQAAWIREASSISAAAVADVRFSLNTTKYSRFMLDIQDITPTAGGTGSLYLRFSVDGGANYAFGATDYFRNAHSVAGGVVASGVDQSAFLALSGFTPSSLFGSLEFTAAAKIGSYDMLEYTPGSLARNTGNFLFQKAGTITHVLIGFVGRNIASHRARLLGAPAW